MAKSVYVLNGPNLNLLGTREPQTYGHATLKDLERLCRDRAMLHKLDLEFRQSNHEGDLIDWIHEAGAKKAVGIVINAGAYTHTSVAIRDAIAAIDVPVVEVHIVPSSEAPGGIGEPGTSAVQPAVANAIFAATGKRLRKMPIDFRQLGSA